MSARRSRIQYDLMETLQMLKFSINHGRELNFTAGLGRQAELQELEERDYIDRPDGFSTSIYFSLGRR